MAKHRKDTEPDYLESGPVLSNRTPQHRAPTKKERLEELRKAIRAENISYAELAELQSMADDIPSDDVELLEWAGVPEHQRDLMDRLVEHLPAQRES